MKTKKLWYKKLGYKEVENWNTLLQQTDASFFQYPYFNEGYSSFPKSRSSYYALYEGETIIGLISCVTIRIGFIKIGLILRGPVILVKEKTLEVIRLIKKIQSKEFYFFIRLNPNNGDTQLVDNLDNSSSILKLDPFPMYRGSQGLDYIVKKIDKEEDLLASYKSRARKQIKYAKEESFTFTKSNSLEDLEKVYDLFKKVSEKKKFIYRPLKSYKRILECGKEKDLCSLYMASIDGKVVNAAIVVKDGLSYNYLSGGLIEGGYKPRNSPSTLLHHLIIKDCFFADDKKWYNISYTSSTHPVYIFKSSFNPVEIPYPSYYTITSYHFLVKVFNWFVVSFLKGAKSIIRRRIGNR